jgi:DNA-binding response OmpR family regulator
MRILLVEDDRELAEAVARALKTENFVVDLALNGEDGQHFGDTEPYDAAVLDLGLPKVTGVAVLKAWRAAGRGLPVLILTARDGWSDKVEGFKAGADDYLVKPFRMEELVMRLRALIRRAAGHASPLIVCGPLTFDAQLGSFTLDGMPLRLTALEWRVLSCLALRAEHVVSRTDLFQRVYDGETEVESNSVEVIVARLRRKIGHDLIETSRGRGYRLTAGPP